MFDEATERFFTLLYAQIGAALPKGHTNMHPYSTGKTYSNMKFIKNENGYKIIISDGVDYSRYFLGYGNTGRLTAKTERQARNYKIIDNAIKSVSQVVASSFGGGVSINGNKVY